MKLIGLTGGIGSGKSTVARRLVEHGFTIVDADAIAREVVEPGQPALAELAEEFGADILDEDGALRRSVLAQRAFATAEATAALNAITHPRIREETNRQFAEAEQCGDRVVIYDMPLLVEQGLHNDMDLTVVVDVAAETRVRRLVESRGLEEDDARRRIAAQISDEKRREAADVVIDNNVGLPELYAQVDELAARLS
ncbi:dephospho-CoA kinase [Corynebacterium tapiri]|uniref:Dephospho-CoA kinase n=1 Tax=Corynebacterium tapiri TaxID=1448266 RepID=A0A5C4U6D5_9CORY|nr:dephospho-CoA kinase [Corynebacterium tapiri]TNL99833.1 dephospho-CoA kinase [Corynebacterium tapiri]